MTTAGISDFTLHDINKPEYKRLRRNISAVINFAKFREERLTHYVEYTGETDALASTKQLKEEENERLTAEVRAGEARRAEEAPEEARLSAENAEREVTVRELYNQQTALQKESHALKARLHEVQDAVREGTFKALEAKEEEERLRAQIVPDPKKLKADLAELHAAVAAEKRALKAVEAKAAQLATQAAVLERSEREMDEVLALQAEAEAEQSKLRETQRRMKDISEREGRDEGERSEHMHQARARCPPARPPARRVAVATPAAYVSPSHAPRVTCADQGVPPAHGPRARARDAGRGAARGEGRARVARARRRDVAVGGARRRARAVLPAGAWPLPSRGPRIATASRLPPQRAAPARCRAPPAPCQRGRRRRTTSWCASSTTTCSRRRCSTRPRWAASSSSSSVSCCRSAYRRRYDRTTPRAPHRAPPPTSRPRGRCARTTRTSSARCAA